MRKIIKLLFQSVMGAMIVFLFFMMLTNAVEMIVHNTTLFTMFLIAGSYVIYKLTKKEIE